MCVAGVVGFEPTVHGTKNRCLTTWLHPIGDGCLVLAWNLFKGFYEGNTAAMSPWAVYLSEWQSGHTLSAKDCGDRLLLVAAVSKFNRGHFIVRRLNSQIFLDMFCPPASLFSTQTRISNEWDTACRQDTEAPQREVTGRASEYDMQAQGRTRFFCLATATASRRPRGFLP